jgi:hypothetical protein
MWMFKSKDEEEAIEISRRNIQETRDIVIANDTKLCSLSSRFDTHIVAEEEKFDNILDGIKNLPCPKEDIILGLEQYRIEQNGHLKKLHEQGDNNTEKLNAIINFSKGEEREKEARNRKWTLWAGLLAAILVAAGLWFQLAGIKENQTEERAVLTYKIEQLEEKIE